MADHSQPPGGTAATGRRPWWEWLAIVVGVAFFAYSVGGAIYTAYLYSENRKQDSELERFRNESECRSQIVADDAVALSNRNTTSANLILVAATAVLANEESIPEEQRALYREIARGLPEAIDADIRANEVRFEMSQRRSQLIELCASGVVPEPQVEPIPPQPLYTR